MSVYLPENSFVVCTKSSVAEYKKLLVSGEVRNFITVQTKIARPFLVVLDRNLSNNFTKCTTNWNSGFGAAAVGAGVIVGLGATVGLGVAGGLTVAAAIAVVPFAGWIVGGAIAVCCLIYGVSQMLKKPTCIEMVGFEESMWKLPHPTVRFDGKNVEIKEKHNALLNTSFLVCKEGGILMPFIDENKAKEAAEVIKKNNDIDFWTTGSISFFCGFMCGFGMTGTTSILAGFGSFALWTGGGLFVIQPISNAIGYSIAQNSENENYNRIRENAEQSYWPSISDVSPDDNIDIEGAINILTAAGVNSQGKSELTTMIKVASKGGAGSTFNNIKELSIKYPNGYNLLQQIKAGEYGQSTYKAFYNSKGNLRGMNRTNRTNANQAANKIPASSRMQTFNRIGSLAAVALACIQPGFSTWLGEKTIEAAANIWAADYTNSISVVSSQ